MDAKEAEETWRLVTHADLGADNSWSSWIVGPGGQTLAHFQAAAEALNALQQQLADLKAERDRYREALVMIEKADKSNFHKPSRTALHLAGVARAALISPSPIAPEEAQG